jgi:hypothetical protein
MVPTIALGVAVVLRAVRGVDLVVHVVPLDEEDVLVDAAGLDAAFVTHLNTAEPRGRASVDGADVQVVAVANDPDRHRLSERAVAPQRCDLELLCRSDPVELVARPCAHSCFSLRDPCARLSGRSAAPAFPDSGAELGRDHDLLAHRRKGFAHEFFVRKNGPYASAVSKKVTPRSKADRMRAIISCLSAAGPYPKLMPMQPSPMAETSMLLFPRVRFCIACFPRTR